MVSKLENEDFCIKHCWGVCEQNSIANSVHADDWTAELNIFVKNEFEVGKLITMITIFLKNFKQIVCYVFEKKSNIFLLFISECEADRALCRNNGTCSLNDQGAATCACVGGYEGVYCTGRWMKKNEKIGHLIFIKQSERCSENCSTLHSMIVIDDNFN